MKRLYKSKPLTLQELNGMDGEPVWIKERKGWGIVSILKNRLYVCGPGFSISIEKNDLHCYSKKPMFNEGDTQKWHINRGSSPAR